jgi:hypothetical protein
LKISIFKPELKNPEISVIMNFNRSGFCLLFFCVLFFALLSELRLQAQSEKYIIQMVKGDGNEPRIVVIDDDSMFKLKLNNGQKIKGKVQYFAEAFFVSEKGDTVQYNGIDWIKLSRELTEFQKIAAFTGLGLGAFLSFATVPAAMYFIVVEANYVMILAPIATVSTAVIGLRLLTGRRYHLDKWKIQSMNLQ